MMNGKEITEAVDEYLIKEGWCQWSDFEWRGQECNYRMTALISRVSSNHVLFTVFLANPETVNDHSNSLTVNFNESETTASNVYSALDRMLDITKKTATFFQEL
jgi:hypothetical protein